MKKLFLNLLMILMITSGCTSTKLGFNDGKTNDHHWYSDPTRPEIRRQAEKNKKLKLQRMGSMH